MAEAAVGTERAPRKRSRTRKPSAGGGSVKLAPGSLAGPVESVPEPQPAAVAEPVIGQPAEALVAQPTAEKAEPRKRTRTRKSAAAKVETGAPVADAHVVDALEAEAAEPTAEKAEPRKRTRTRKAAAEAVATTPDTGAKASEDLGVDPVANPRRTRVRATRSRKSAAAEPVVETPSAQQ